MPTKQLPKALRDWAEKNPDKFEEGWTEQDGFTRDGSWSHWIYLKPGWINTAHEVHLVHEGTVRECLEVLRDSIEPCECDDCKANGLAAWR